MNDVMFYNLKSKGTRLADSTLENIRKSVEEGKLVVIGTAKQKEEYKQSVYLKVS